MNIENAIRSLGATNAAPLFPDGNPDDVTFDIHNHLENTMDLLNVHLPLPPVPDQQSEIGVASYMRRVEATEQQRIAIILNTMKGSAKRLIKAEPEETFGTMERT